MSLNDLLTSVKKGIVRTGLGLSLILSPLYGCGGEENREGPQCEEPPEDTTLYECYSREQCEEGEDCVEGVCQESEWPECPLREYVDRCESLKGIYKLVESSCSLQYNEMSFEMDQSQEPMYESGEECRPVYVVGINKKTTEKNCLGNSPFGSSSRGYDNQVEVDSYYTFTKCDDEIVRMRWNLGDCEAWLRKTSPEPVEGRYSTGSCF